MYTLPGAYRALQEKRLDEAREMAFQLETTGDLAPDEWGGPMLVLGAVTMTEAEKETDPKLRHQLWQVATRFLEESYQRGFPVEKRSEALCLLARGLCYLEEFPQALPILRAAWKENPERRGELHGLMARTLSRDANPQWNEALWHNTQQLDNRLLSPTERRAALIDRGHILIGTGDLKACRELVDQLSPSLPTPPGEVFLLRARLFAAEAEALAAMKSELPKEAKEKFAEAIASLREALAADEADESVQRAAHYVMGTVYRRLQDRKAAKAQFTRVRKLFPETAEEFAASLFEAQVLSEMGEAEEALPLYLAVLHRAGSPARYTNRWLPLAQLQDGAMSAFRHYRDHNEFHAAQEIAAALPPLFPRWQGVLLEAQTLQDWGRHLAEKAEAHEADPREEELKEARKKFRLAGAAYHKLAKLRLATREFPEDLFKSGESYLAGQDYAQAAALFRKCHENATAQRGPLALVGLAEAEVAEGKFDAALASLTLCLTESPQHPAIYKARLLGSRALMEKGDLVQAQAWLQANLEHELLTPRSLEWRDSLFALGEVYYLQGIREIAKARLGDAAVAALEAKLAPNPVSAPAAEKKSEKASPPPAATAAKSDEPAAEKTLGDATPAADGQATRSAAENGKAALQLASKYLSQAVERYPDAPQALSARYRIADAHRQAARILQQQLAGVTIEATRATLQDQVRKELTSAIERFTELQKLLGERKQLTSLEQMLLRNCHFALGAAHFDLGDYRAAIDAYSTATNLYQHEPVALEAYVQIASCYRQLQRPLDARSMLEQAKAVLTALPANAPLEATTRYSRQDWTKLLDWMSTL